MVDGDAPSCQRCHRPVRRNAAQFDVFDRMHWACFHYEFEHYGGSGDPDQACGDPSCPARAFDPAPPKTWLVPDPEREPRSRRNKWTPTRYAVVVRHDEGEARFSVVSRVSSTKAVAIAVIHFLDVWPHRHILDLTLERVGVAEEEETEHGIMYPHSGNPNNEVFDPVEWM